MLRQPDILDRLKDEGVATIEEEEESIEIGSETSEINDKEEAWGNEILRVLEDRFTSYAEDYPFSYEQPTSINLKKNLNYKQELYIVLLLSSNLDLFNKVYTELTTDFETISFYALKSFLPLHAQVKNFGKNSEYKGNAKAKIRALASDMKMGIREQELDNISDLNMQEKGLDVIGWIPFGDSLPNMITILGQCACGKEWYKKYHDVTRYETYFDFYRLKPCKAMFIPYSLVNYAARCFYRSDDVENGSLLFERKRIVEYFNSEEEFAKLNSKNLVGRCLTYSEDLV